MCISIQVYISIFMKKKNVVTPPTPSTTRLSPQWLFGNSCTSTVVAHDVSSAQIHELPQSYCSDNQEWTLFS